MLNEIHATILEYDGPGDSSRLVVTNHTGAGAGAKREAVTLLLDGAGYLVGVDVGREPNRFVVLLGTHESVRKTLSANGEVARDAAGAPAWIRIANAKSLFRGDETNPYARS